MKREFPDELLSAFLDDELSPAERQQVEQHLAASEADRQLLTELKALRSDVAALPKVSVNPDFTDRVVRAALAEAERHSPAGTAVSLPQPSTNYSRRQWAIGAAVASAAALAACFLLVFQPWRGDSSGDPILGPALTVHDQIVNSLREAAPKEGQAVVLRLRVSKDMPLAAAIDAALGKAGLNPLAPNAANEAAALAAAYRKTLEERFPQASPGTENTELMNATVAAAQAVFVEAPLAQLESVLSELGAGQKTPLRLNPECLLAYGAKSDGPEGEPGSAKQTAKGPTAGQAFARRLDAELFRLEKRLAAAANAATAPQQPVAAIDPQQLVRVLILVEAE
jgi:anti-sigma factor RsiW